MSDNSTNPYAPSPVGFDPVSPLPVDAATLSKIKAIIKDADQFWLAILLCVLCSGIGSLIIGIWYLVRLLQWNSMSKQQPLLMVANPERSSIAAKFQGAKTKLIIGLVFGMLMLFLVFVYIVLVVVGSFAMQSQN